jgi:hypothetical protein
LQFLKNAIDETLSFLAYLLLKSILSELLHKKTDLSVKRSAKIYSLVLITKLI